MFLGGQPRHCICTNASRGLSATAEFLVSQPYAAAAMCDTQFRNIICNVHTTFRNSAHLAYFILPLMPIIERIFESKLKYHFTSCYLPLRFYEI